jgi:hypothetical protein
MSSKVKGVSQVCNPTLTDVFIGQGGCLQSLPTAWRK